MRKLKNPLLESAVILAVATAFLYCSSTAYNGGFLGLLHLDANALERDFHQVLYNGVLVSLGPVLLALICYAVASYCYSHALLPGLNDWLRNRFSRKRRYLKLKHRLIEKRKDSPREKQAKQHTVTVFRFVIVCFVFVSSMIYFEAQGRKEARRLHKELEKTVVQSNLVSTEINDKQYKLVKIACGARNCAGIDPSTKIVYYFPSSGYSFLYVPPAQEPTSQNSTKTP
jgi:hypothetical protein